MNIYYVNPNPNPSHYHRGCGCICGPPSYRTAFLENTAPISHASLDLLSQPHPVIVAFIASMARAELALQTLFYLYPVLLTLTLIGAQCLLFFRNRRREAARIANPSPSDHEPKRPERTRRICAWLIWSLQLVQSALLIASTSLAAKEALADHGEAPGTTAFPFSAYLVSAPTTCACSDGPLT